MVHSDRSEREGKRPRFDSAERSSGNSRGASAIRFLSLRVHQWAGADNPPHAKEPFDARAKIAPWTIHDLRRTAKSLMARAGVRPDVSERVLGHVIKGVEGIYDRHDYREEKADALRKLAALLADIVKSPQICKALENKKFGGPFN